MFKSFPKKAKSVLPAVYSTASTNSRALLLSHEHFPSKILRPDQPPLAILHGILGSKMNWRTIASHISRSGHEVVTMDLRNHGTSPHSDSMTYDLMVDDLIHSMHSLLGGQQPFSAMGHSAGGKIAMLAALKHPELISRLVIIDILPSSVVSAGAPFVIDMLQVMRGVQLDTTAKSLGAARKSLMQQLTSKIAEKRVCQWLALNLDFSLNRGPFWRCNVDAIRATIPLTVSFPDTGAYRPFTKPVLFIEGENSEHMKVPNRDLILQRLFPSASSVVVKDASHWLHVEKPFDFLRTVEDFLSES